MKIIYNNIIPFPGYKAINLFGVLFVRQTAVIDEVTLNHESIHSGQWRELLYVGFLLWYAIEYLIRLIRLRKHHLAYRRISFEREAYAHQNNLEYVNKRKPYAFVKYMG